jgi:hypothetical protein
MVVVHVADHPVVMARLRLHRRGGERDDQGQGGDSGFHSGILHVLAGG